MWDIYPIVKGPKISHPRGHNRCTTLSGNITIVSSSYLYPNGPYSSTPPFLQSLPRFFVIRRSVLGAGRSRCHNNRNTLSRQQHLPAVLVQVPASFCISMITVEVALSLVRFGCVLIYGSLPSQLLPLLLSSVSAVSVVRCCLTSRLL